ncbi:CBS domain-containing protein [Hansschlegelia sp. KR7-227]|uniref:CBS domain-containing protein n=1 Tax=Hansschlegelia sp. KR7-227 TaxID=3400914 RepID=UPI003C0BB1E9
MISNHEELSAVLADLKAGRTAQPVTIRTFLSWFGFQRRTPLNVQYINSKLEQIGIRTVPDYLNIWVETPIAFELIDSKRSRQKTAIINQVQLNEVVAEPNADDPSFKIEKIRSANTPPTFVKPNDTLLTAVTLMMTKNFSQLPVMTNERDVKGIVSWKSIGTRSITTASGVDVQKFMEEHQEIPASASMFDAIRIIEEYDYVLVRATDRRITGIVTATDIALQFELTSTPFLLISEIENSVRSLISNKLPIEQIKKTLDPNHTPEHFTHVSQLTFGNCVRLIEHKENWSVIGFNLDRTSFCSALDEINSIRNDVMHFDPDTPEGDDIIKLKNIAKMFRHLKEIRAY